MFSLSCLGTSSSFGTAADIAQGSSALNWFRLFHCKGLGSKALWMLCRSLRESLLGEKEPEVCAQLAEAKPTRAYSLFSQGLSQP